MRVREARACGLDGSPPISTTNISTTGFNAIANCLVNRQRPHACEKRVVKSNSKEIFKAGSLGDTQALENAWTASGEYTARNKAGKARLTKHKNTKAENKEAALAP